MPTTVILPETLRGSVVFGHAGDALPNPIHRDAAQPQNYRIDFPSVDWLLPGLTMDVSIEASFDGGVSWSGFTAFDGISGVIGKSGVVQSPAVSVSWDGQAMDLRGSITVGPIPYIWGLSVTTV